MGISPTRSSFPSPPYGVPQAPSQGASSALTSPVVASTASAPLLPPSLNPASVVSPSTLAAPAFPGMNPLLTPNARFSPMQPSMATLAQNFPRLTYVPVLRTPAPQTTQTLSAPPLLESRASDAVNPVGVTPEGHSPKDALNTSAFQTAAPEEAAIPIAKPKPTGARPMSSSMSSSLAESSGVADALPLSPAERTGQQIGQAITKLLESNPELQEHLTNVSLDNLETRLDKGANTFKETLQQNLKKLPLGSGQKIFDKLKQEMLERTPPDYQPLAQRTFTWLETPPIAQTAASSGTSSSAASAKVPSSVSSSASSAKKDPLATSSAPHRGDPFRDAFASDAAEKPKRSWFSRRKATEDTNSETTAPEPTATTHPHGASARGSARARDRQANASHAHPQDRDAQSLQVQDFEEGADLSAYLDDAGV